MQYNPLVGALGWLNKWFTDGNKDSVLSISGFGVGFAVFSLVSRRIQEF